MIKVAPSTDATRRFRFREQSALPSYKPRTIQASYSPMVERAPQAVQAVAKVEKEPDNFVALAKNLSPSLASILRPNGAFRWQLPSVAAITPQYIEGVLRGALAGNHVQAWELFDLMVDTDPEIASCVGEFIDGVVSKKLIVEPYADDGEEPSEDAILKQKIVLKALKGMRPDAANDENDFRGTLKDILFARFHGQSVIEIDWYNQAGDALNIVESKTIGKVVVPRTTYWVHPVCYAWDMNGRLGLRMALESQLRNAMEKMKGKVPGTVFQKPTNPQKTRSLIEPDAWNWVTSQARPSQLMDFPPNKFLIGTDKFKAGTVMGSGSILRVLAWWWIASMYSWDFMLNYAQLFGIPFRKATIAPGTSETKKGEIRQLLQSMGSAGYIMLDAGNQVDFERAASGAGESPQAFLAHFANDQKRKAILRQTMSGGTAGGGSKGVGKSFGETEAQGPKDQCFESAANFAAGVINNQLIPALLRVNYGDDGDNEAPTVKLVDAEAGDLQAAQTLQAVSGLVDVGEDFARRLFNIPKPSPDEKILGKDTGSVASKAQMGGGFGGGGSQFDNYTPDEGGEIEPGDDEAGNDQAQQEQENDSASVESRSASHPVRKSTQGVGIVTRALKDTTQPLVNRLKAIDAIKDATVKRVALQKLLHDIPQISAALKHDTSLAEATARAIAVNERNK